jgi:peptide/nickel transport system permease protein
VDHRPLQRLLRRRGSGAAWFLIQRIGGMIVLLIVMSLVVFSLMYIEPGNVARNLLGTRPVTPQALAAITAAYHLNDSFLQQYWIWVTGALHGNFGTSVQSGSPVGQEITSRLALTAEMILLALIVGLVLAVPAGVISGMRQSGPIDRVSVVWSIITLSAPPFALGLLMLYVLANDLGWFPIYGAGSGFFGDLYHLALPALTLALGFAGFVLKITRAAVIQETSQDYVMFARSRGLSQWRITRLVVRNACIPVVTSFGLALAYLIGSTVVVEQMFSLPGLGSLLEEAVTFKDVPVVQALTVLTAAAIAVVALLVDLAYLALDPQLRKAVISE